MIIIMPVNLASIDLKLLVVFDAVMVERSVSRAAHRLGMSQPAMSNALNRLRLMLKDQLFLRSAEGMRPTQRALELAPPITEALRQIETALEPARFAPADANWVFKLALSDHASVVILPRLLTLLDRAAPDIRLRIQPKRNPTIQDKLDAADVDLAVGIIPNLPRRFAQSTLFEDRYVCMMRRQHPSAGKPITREAFAAAQHLAVRPSLDIISPIDQRLKQHGVSRKVVLNVTQYLAVPNVLRQFDLVACLFETVAKQFDGREFYFSPMPFALEPMNVVLAWSRARTHHAANTWMRQKLVEACRELRAEQDADHANVTGLHSVAARRSRRHAAK
jgi:DNA-binding transcriptional LysR family regulator